MISYKKRAVEGYRNLVKKKRSITPQLCLQWAIPEKNHTITRMAFWNSEGKGGFFELEIRRHGGILTIGIPKALGGRGVKAGIFTRDRRECIP